MTTGYEAMQLESANLQLLMREEVEKMLDNNRFIFSEERKLFLVWCQECKDAPCIWTANKLGMIAFDEVTHDKNTEANKR
jgi:succinylarginine dihydrolase